MELRALIFDVDGTLADTERDGHRLAFNQTFLEAGLDWHWDVALYGELLAVAGGKERMKFYIERYRPDFLKFPDIDAMIAGLYRNKTRHYAELLATGKIPLRPGVERLLLEAREAGIRLAIATTTSPENVTALLSCTLGDNSIDWFEVIAAGDIVKAKKPAPDIYLWALRNMQEKAPISAEHCLVFEDSENGIRASLGAGLRTVITVNGYTVSQCFEGADVVLSDLGEPTAPCQVLHGSLNGNSYVHLQALASL